MSEQKSAAELAGEIKADFEKKFDTVKQIAEKAVADAGKGLPMAESAKAKADEALTGMNEAKVRLDELEQKMARKGVDQPDEEKSIGQKFVESDSMKALHDSSTRRGKASMEVKATITLATGTSAGNLGQALNPTRLPGIIAPPNRRMTVRDLITPGTMSQSAIEYVRETGFTNSAATVAEGVVKSASDIKMDLVLTGAKVIAHYMKASRQALDDLPQLQSYIDGRLLYGLAYVEEQQLLNGDGTGQNLLGIIPQATAYSAAFMPDSASDIDTLRLAMLQATLAEYPASGHVMHPTNWAKIETTKDAEGRYIVGDPRGMLTPTLWSLPVVATQAIAANKFLTGAFMMGAQLFDRWLARVEVATENEDDFIKNLITILAEERLALAVYRPQAFVYGTIGV